MKKLAFILMLFISANSIGQELNCTKLKIGLFKIMDAEYGNILIERTESKLTTFNEKSRWKVESEIEWINDCTYISKNTKILENPNNTEILEGEGTATIKIIEIRKNSYLEEITEDTFYITMQREVIMID